MKVPTLGVMIDVETLGQRSNAVAWQVAMIPWLLADPDADAGQPLHSYLGIEPQQQLIPARKIDASTLLYWMEQSDEARATMKLSDSTDFVELEAYMRHFISRFERITDGHEYEVWTRGNFDLPIIESLLEQLGMKAPWHFRSTRDLRTLMEVAGVDWKTIPEPHGFIKHNALWDCKFQITCYNEAMRVIRSRV